MVLGTTMPVSLENMEQAYTTTLVLSKDGVWLTFQGEGPRLGQQTIFLRLSGCNLSCSWCDTPYTWDWTGKNGTKYNPGSESQKQNIVDVVRRLNEFNSSFLTITGGEPLLQQKGLNVLFGALVATNPASLPRFEEINFETNGTRLPQWDFMAKAVAERFHYVVSPKLKNSGCGVLQSETKQADLDTLHAFGETVESDFKFVCQGPKDLEEVAIIAEVARLPHNRIWIMPEGRNAGEVNNSARDLADPVLKMGWNLTTRFHLQLWGNVRAR